jgi:hypothetical protein
MKNSTKTFTAIAIVLLVAAGLLWHRALCDERRAKPALERPISFEQGFSFNSSFTVPETGYYFVELVFPRDHSPMPREHDVKYENDIAYGISSFGKFGNNYNLPAKPVKFTITCDGKIVAEGGGDTPCLGGGSSYAEQSVHMATFKAEPGQDYEISFRTTSSLPILDTTKPMLRIYIPFWAADLFDFHYWLIPISFARDVALLGLLFAISPCSFLVQKLLRHKTQSK